MTEQKRGRPPLGVKLESLRAWITAEQKAWLLELAATNPDGPNISWAVRRALEIAMEKEAEAFAS